MERLNAQPTFTDLTVADLGGPRAIAFFKRCEQEVPFDRLAASVADVFDEDQPRGGRPHWPLVTMVKIVFLQKCFGLSDPMTEEMLRDRISFRQFLGLSFDDGTPDHSTICTFRRRLRERGHGSTLFDESVRILREKGLVMNGGTLIDATIIEAPIGGKRANGSSSADPCNTRTVKGGRAYNGHRAHVATDTRGIITDFIYDTASVSEHDHFDPLAANEDDAVYADSGCRSKDRVATLQARGVRAYLCHRRVRAQAELTPEQRRFNAMIAPIRAFVEHPFAWLKQWLNNRRARYRGLVRNGVDFALSAMAYNFCRSFTFTSAVIGG